MRPWELQVGDLTRDQGNKVHKVSMSDFWSASNGGDVFERLKPIRITRSFLADNGFVKEDADNDKYYFGDVKIVFGDEVPIELKYVHELQHLMRIVGMTKESRKLRVLGKTRRVEEPKQERRKNGRFA